MFRVYGLSAIRESVRSGLPETHGLPRRGGRDKRALQRRAYAPAPSDDERFPVRGTPHQKTRGRNPFVRSTLACRSRRRNYSERSTDRKSTRLNSSHQIISYAVFCLKKKITINIY